MAYQRGSLKEVSKMEGNTWLLRYRVTRSDGRRVENTKVIGLVRDFPKKKDAWHEVGRLGLLVKINETRIRFDSLAEHYLTADFGADAMRPKSENTTAIVEHIVRDYLIPRWGNEIADEIKSLDIQRWLQSLSPELAWPTIAKMRGVMSRTYKVGIRHALVSTNPLLHVETRCTSSYRAIVLSPEQTLAILKSLATLLHRILVLTCAATALRASELLALLWSDIRWDEGRIRVSKRWANGKHGQTKTEASDGYVPLHPILAQQLRGWHTQTPYGKETDFIFPSLQADGRVPLSLSAFVGDHLRPAAKAAGVKIEGGQRFGLHNLRHSLSNFLVNKAKVQPKTVQSILRHSRIQTTLDLYTQEDGDETRAAQGQFLQALGMQAALEQ
jgi:integrase